MTALKPLIILICLTFLPSAVWAQSSRSAVDTVPVTIDVLDLKEMEVGDVLKYLSNESGVNIVKSPNVRGKVSIYLKNIEPLEALDIIVQTYGWVIDKSERLMTVMTDKDYEIRYGRKFGETVMATQVVDIAFAEPKKLESTLSMIKSEVGQIIPDEKSRTLILIDTPLKIQQMIKVIDKIDVALQTRVFDVSYANIESLAADIEQVLTSGVGTLRFNRKAKRMIVSDTFQKLQEIERMIKAFDTQQQEVLIEAKIVQVTLDDEYKLGVDWQGIVRDRHNLTLGGDFDILGINEKKGTISIGTLQDDDYSFLLEALETVGDSRILSSPSITAIDGEEARILVGSQEPYVTTTTTTTASGPATTAEDVKFIDVGVKLYVTPTIHKDRFITMSVRPEVSSVVRNLVTSNNNIIPVVDTSEAQTKVMVKDQTTLVIGGLIKEEQIDAVSQVPVIGDIPVVGVLFRNTRNFDRVSEIVIFLTPTIVTGDQ